MDKIDIDPDGDVFLILNCEEGQFLDASSWPESVENPLCLLSGGVREEPADGESIGDDFSNDGPDTAALIATKALDDQRIKAKLSQACWRPVKNELQGDSDDSVVQKFQVRVSAKHLSVSSMVFRAMLSKQFKEGDALLSKGITSIKLPDDPPIALLIILCNLHNRMRKVPKAINLDLLTDVAVLVDKYRLHDAMAFLSDLWVDSLKDSLPANLGDDLYKWICVSWVFSKPAEFKKATQIAQFQAESRLDGYADLPVPDTVIDKIEDNRQQAIFEIAMLLHGYLVKYGDPEIHCSFECDAMVLGALTKNLKSLSLLDSGGIVLPPYTGLSFATFDKRVRNLSFPTLQATISRRSHYDYGDYGNGLRKCIDIKPTVENLLTKLKGKLRGLDIADFSPKKRRDDVK